MNFLEMARLLEHDEGLLAAGEEVCTYRVLSLETAHGIVSRATPEERVLRQQSYFHHDIAARVRLGQGYHDRGEAYLFAAGVLDEEDRRFIAKQMPMPARCISVAEKVIAPGGVWDVSVRAQRWGKDDKQDCFAIVNVGTLRLGREARLEVHGNILSLLCQRVISEDGAFRILPTPYSPDDRRGPLNGVRGLRGHDGVAGEGGRELHLFNSILGPVLPEGYDLSSLHGRHGTDATQGTNAGHGRCGGMCKLAEITIRGLEGQLTVWAQAGAGGSGGDGGDGGHGGDGGPGASGRKAVGVDVRGGHGGDAGHGGDGGRGGNGGHGGLSSNIFISLPSSEVGNLRAVSLPSPAGAGGHGGKGGKAGVPGPGGSCPSASHKLDGQPGNPGLPGVDGKQGKNGRSRPAPWIFVNEQRQQGEETWTSMNVQRNSATPVPGWMQERPFDQP